MGIARRLGGHSPALRGILRPVTGVGDEGAEPEDQKGPVPENLEGFTDSRARQTVRAVEHYALLTVYARPEKGFSCGGCRQPGKMADWAKGLTEANEDNEGCCHRPDSKLYRASRLTTALASLYFCP